MGPVNRAPANECVIEWQEGDERVRCVKQQHTTSSRVEPCIASHRGPQSVPFRHPSVALSPHSNLPAPCVSVFRLIHRLHSYPGRCTRTNVSKHGSLPVEHTEAPCTCYFFLFRVLFAISPKDPTRAGRDQRLDFLKPCIPTPHMRTRYTQVADVGGGGSACVFVLHVLFGDHPWLNHNLANASDRGAVGTRNPKPEAQDANSSTSGHRSSTLHPRPHLNSKP